MEESAGNWCLIESDPGVFTELIRKFGVHGVEIEELWSMEDSAFDRLRPIHGLIFLFKYLPNEPPTGRFVTDPQLMQKIFFAKQVINNACATQAVISLLLNCDHPSVFLGYELTKLKEFSRNFDPKMRGLVISNSTKIRAAHNSMVQQTLFELDNSSSGKEEEAYHYVSYIPIDGRIYELDGLREAPMDHGAVPPAGSGKDWIDVIKPIITKRIQLFKEGEIHFNLMALVSDRKMAFATELVALMDTTLIPGADLDAIEVKAARLRRLLQCEDDKLNKYYIETARRRHNYLPFIITLLQILAEERKLSSLMEKSAKRAMRRATKRMKT